MDFLFASSGTSILRYGKIKISSKECKNHRNKPIISIAYYRILRPNGVFYLPRYQSIVGMNYVIICSY